MTELERINTEAIKEKISLVELVKADGHTLTEHKDGYHFGPCPFCGEGNDRFKIFNNSGAEYFYCRRCERGHKNGKGGDVIQYTMMTRNLAFPDACRWLDSANVPDIQKSNGKARENGSKSVIAGETWQDWQQRLDPMMTEAIHHLLEGRSEAAKAALAWLADRGIRGQDCANFGIGFNDQWRQIIAGYKLPPGITLPRWCNESNLVAVNVYLAREARQNGDTRRYVKGSRPKSCLYNQLRIDDAETIFICEGELDAILLSRFLPPNARAVATGGAAMQPDDISLLDNKRVILALDNDEAGIKAAAQWFERLQARGHEAIPQIILPVKDITDYWKQGGNLAELVKGIT